MSSPEKRSRPVMRACPAMRALFWNRLLPSTARTGGLLTIAPIAAGSSAWLQWSANKAMVCQNVLAEIYQSKWPKEKIRVEVCAFANSAGAYTTLDPLHVTIASTDPRNQGSDALGVLFLRVLSRPGAPGTKCY